MKKSVSDFTLSQRIQAFMPEMQGVFSTSDLYNLINARSSLTSQRTIKRMLGQGILTRCQRGIYVTQKFDPLVLAMRMKPQSYVSMDTVLALQGLVGTLSPNRTSLVTLGRNQKIKINDHVLFFHSIDKKLFFGSLFLKPGIRIADNEKSFIDLLYYYTRGYEAGFDPAQEVNISRLDIKKIKKYLKKYSNPKFTQFVKGVISV